MRRFAPLFALALAVALPACAPPSDAEIAADIEKGMRAAPGGKLFTETLRAELPEDYRRLIAEGVRVTRAGGGEAGARQMIEGFMNDLVVRHKDDIAHAPEAELSEYREARLRALKVVRAQSVELCAQWSMSQPLTAAEPGNRQRLALVSMQAALFRAMSAGKRAPVERAAPGAEDWMALQRQMSADGTSDADIAVLAEPGRFATAGAETQCRLEAAIIGALSRMPDAQANRVTVATMVGG